ncbi:hypothetical protein ACIHCX_26515 [Streptomyces sp. NPDC052043]|uniref:hypothetical protein n=1 Tax=Streptomyces sp. NPDC052043 TaxID=3365684 RepID=UPI0037D7A3B1
MSDSIAYPVFRTADPASALRVARQLVAVGDPQQAEVSVARRRSGRPAAEERHASWLAGQIGQSVIGPPQE